SPCRLSDRVCDVRAAVTSGPPSAPPVLGRSTGAGLPGLALHQVAYDPVRDGGRRDANANPRMKTSRSCLAARGGTRGPNLTQSPPSLATPGPLVGQIGEICCPTETRRSSHYRTNALR